MATKTGPKRIGNDKKTATKKENPATRSDSTGDLVVVGSSAGGVAALSVLVNTLSADFPAPIVLAQHLDPQRASHLATILERQSKLPILTVGEHAPTLMQPGTIYVVPANRHVTIQDSSVRLESDSDGRPIPSVDRLLSSAAKAYGEHLVAVILTGSGSDGAAGAVEVKEAGGVVIIQNPRTAPYPSMPQSLPPTVVDHVVEIEQIGPLLFDLLTGVRLAPEKVEDPLRDLLTYVSQHANMDFRNYKPSTILRRISRRMAVLHSHTLRDYTDHLRAHPEEVTELVKAFLINVTGFFRDRDAFEFLKDFVVPDMIERGRDNGRVLRAWSAGCSTGEEAYSIAILLAEVLGAEISEWSIKIFATDLDDEAVNFARRGLYPTKLLSDLPGGFTERYFERIDHGYRVSKSLRQMVIYGSQDLTRGIPFPRMDLVVCRNLLIYLKPELQQDILDLFAYSLHQTSGYLFLGKAETARPSKATFDLINKKWKVYRCTSGPLALPAHGKPVNSRQAEWQTIRRSDSPEKTDLGEDITPLRRINEVMFRYLPIGIVVIDRGYRIVTINAAARRLLSIRDITTEQDFLHNARGLPYGQVREAIDAAFTDHSTGSLTDIEADTGSGRFLSLTIMPAHIDDNSKPLAVVTVTDVTESVVTKRRLEDVQNEQAKILEELGSTNKRLTSINIELQEANEELQSANEELMLTQEELQATNEEFEATNEELQATNEELETNNEELQATNEELQTTNDELTARSNELQETARELETARSRLDTIVQQFPYLVMTVKGPKLEIDAFNARYGLIFGDRNPNGTPIEKVFLGEGVGELLKAAKDSLSNNTTVTTPRVAAHIADESAIGSEFVHTIVPLPSEDGKPEGVIIFTLNVTVGESE
ncbi:MAG TPA: CheR family methyltransferase [Pyrinomonadaceae bacterium]|nr:CheR family methyltransferase [Pyrinomonadaceae bacterium]